MNETKGQEPNEPSIQQQAPASTRRTYTAPVLQVFGKLHQLTQSGSGLAMEGASGKAHR